MSQLLDFMAANPFLTWCLAWGIWPVCWLLGLPFTIPLKAYNRHLRSKNIRAHGWPSNPLMDADGDIIHPSKEGTHS